MSEEDKVVEAEYEQDPSQFVLKVAAQIALVCASLMVFFHFYSENIYIATLGFVGGAIIGSIASWKNVQAARALFFLSVLAIEWVITMRVSDSLVPFFAAGDLFLLVFLGYGLLKEGKKRQ
ncbi:Uncharacterised protein [Candidatus Anstonella stagnisolia]|nr:Uncharacterised protein [Candidatus Anstonella stagnisolia]